MAATPYNAPDADLRFSFDGSPWSLCDPEGGRELADWYARFGEGEAKAQEMTCHVCRVPFYPETIRLVCLSCDGGEGKRHFYFLEQEEQQTGKISYHALNGLAIPIHVLNERAPLQLSAETAIAYLSFFSFFVHGDEGPFYVLRLAEDVRVPEASWSSCCLMADGTELTLREMFSPPALRLEITGGGEVYYISALVYYGATVSLCDFALERTGDIRIEESRMLFRDLPGGIETGE